MGNRMRGSSRWEQELMAIRTTQRATQATPAMLGIQGHQLFREQRMEGNANEVLQKKCHDTRESKRERERERETDTYVQHVRPITIIFLTFTLFKLQGSVLASSFVVVVVIVSVSQCFTVTRRSNRLAVDLLPPTTWPPIHLPS